MLGEGLRAGLEHMGVASRVVCYVEREAHAAAVLAARIEEGSLDAAPVWSDLRTFGARKWRGAVDCIAAGFPCQDLSLAGSRSGLDGKRSGLFFDILDIAHDCGAWLLVLENVAAIATATASAVDEAEGDVYERAASRVVGELAERGWNAEWITLPASAVGASHGRERWFCIAWRIRMDDADHDQREGSGVHPRQGQPRQAEALAHGSGCAMADAGHGPRALESEPVAECCGAAELCDGGSGMADADVRGCGERGRVGFDCSRQPAPDAFERDGMADAREPRLSDAQLAELAGAWRWDEGRATAQFRGTPLFAPGPRDERWPGLLAAHPELAPALEPTFRSVVNGLAFDMDDSRAPRLKCIGNGVVAAQAGVAVVELLRRARGAH